VQRGLWLSGGGQEADQSLVGFIAQRIGSHSSSRPLHGAVSISDHLAMDGQLAQHLEIRFQQPLALREDPSVKTAGQQVPSIQFSCLDELLYPLRRLIAPSRGVQLNFEQC
jgi:hypothetical protein